MTMEMFNEKLVEKRENITGPSVSLSYRRTQATFSKEAAKLMNLSTESCYISFGFDKKANQLGFFVSNEPGSQKAQVKLLHVGATNVDCLYVNMASIFDKYPALQFEKAVVFPLHEHEKKYFYISLNEGKSKPSKKK